MRDHRSLVTILSTAVVVLAAQSWLSAAPQDAATDAAAAAPAPDKLAIVWTSNDPAVAHRMTLMYAGAAARQGWFDEVQLIVWGPSQKLVVADKDVRAAIDALREGGVEVVACLACADTYGIADGLREAGLEVRYMGQPLTRFLKSSEWSVVTF